VEQSQYVGRHSSYTTLNLESDIEKRTVNMNKQMKNSLLLVGLLVLLLAACGQVETTPIPADTPEPLIVAENPTDIPTAAPTAESDPEKINRYIGLVYPPSPENLTPGFSMIIQGAGHHSLSLVSDGESRMFWLSQMTHSDADGVAYWEVKDILDLSNVETGLTLIPDGCFLNGVPDSEIIAAGRNGVIVLAWRADTTLNVFESIPVTGIECSSDKALPIT
jgi:hypothetical protein